jgi:PAS domain S-box-containing protein
MSSNTTVSQNHSMRGFLKIVPEALIMVDRKSRIVLANKLAASLVGCTVEELEGLHLEALIPERFREDHARHVARYLGAPELGSFGVVEPQSWALHRDGNEIPVQISLSPWFDGESEYVVAAIHDLSHRHRVEQDLREGEQRFRIAAEHTADIIQEFVVSQDLLIHHGDVDGLMNYPPGGYPTTISGWLELVHPEDRDRIEAGVNQAVGAGAATFRFRYRILAGDGSYHHWLDHGTVTGYLEDGSINTGVGAIQDITEQVQHLDDIARMLRETEELKDRLAAQNVYLLDEILTAQEYPEIIGESDCWIRVLEQVKLVAGSDSAVLLLGETGTGKEVIARALHASSDRNGQPMIKVNCAALPSTLIESELFGHEKGAFSGADAGRHGRFTLADNGTIFLDEIGELPLELQAKLLQVLQSGEFEPLGSTKTVKVDVRIIAATNRNLKAAVQNGRFRSDLYYRLAVFPLELPPLRDRRDDIALLATYFLTRLNEKRGGLIDTIPEPTLAAMQTYDWPGNIRELANMIERGVILSRGRILEIDHSQLRPQSGTPDAGAQTSPIVDHAAALTGRIDPGSSLKEMERTHIISILEACNWTVKGRGNAAESLGMKESTLRSRMKKLGIRRPSR